MSRSGVRSLLNLLFRVGFLAVLGVIAWVVVDNYVPSRHVPWKPADLTQPPGLATKLQVQPLARDLDECLRALREAGVEAEPAEEVDDGQFCKVHNAVRIKSGLTATSPKDLVMSCPLAANYVIWDRQVLQPAAEQLMGSKAKTVVIYGTYACRRRYGRADQVPSEHATASAVDIGEIVLEDGRRVTLLEGWTKDGPEAVFLRRLRQGGCDIFGTALSPDYNAEHANHLHFDMKNWNMCPTGPDPDDPVVPPKPDAAPAKADPAKA
ncbi:MAG TPA: extensin family protein [Caulobacteraceae bacterium]|nr:extensin family protein [Caulobacteraceae bacterium]